MPDADDAIATIIEERNILRMLHRYSHAMDYGLEDEWVNTFTTDAIMDVYHVPDNTTVHREVGSAQLAAYIAQFPKPPKYIKHIMADPIIDIDGDTARVEAYWVIMSLGEEGGAVLRSFGRYKDTLRKVEGEWLIAERKVEIEA